MNSFHLSGRLIAVIGLGYVGPPLAVEFGRKRPVIGFDIKADRITQLRAGHYHTLEVPKDELRKAKYLTPTSNPASLRGASPVEPMIFNVTVPTPVDKANRPDLTPLISASQTVRRALKAGDVVIYESTVYSGPTEEVCVPILERESGLKYLTVENSAVALEGFYCAYSPERINSGDKPTACQIFKKSPAAPPPKWLMRWMPSTNTSPPLARTRRAAYRWPRPPRSLKAASGI